MVNKNIIIGALAGIVIALSICYKEEKSKIVDLNSQIIETRDTLFDIRMRYDGLFDEVLRLEYENQILGSYAANEEYNKKE